LGQHTSAFARSPDCGEKLPVAPARDDSQVSGWVEIPTTMLSQLLPNV